WQLEELRQTVGHAVLIPVGDRPYGPAELAAATGCEVPGTLAWDRRGLGRLLERGADGGWRRTSLARSAKAVLDVLMPSHAVLAAGSLLVGGEGGVGDA